MKNLIDHIKKIVTITDIELDEIAQSFQTRKIKKDAFILKAGQYCDSYYFVDEGTFRIYTILNNKEITSWFAFNGYFFTELESYLNKTPTRFTIQAIETSTIHYIPRKKMDASLEKFPKWNEFVRKTWEQTFVKLNQVVLSFQAQSAGDRYEDLFNHPHFIQKTKQKDLASMLGVTKFSLSRLRRSK